MKIRGGICAIPPLSLYYLFIHKSILSSLQSYAAHG
jgi:hypothetical protein